jgi:hypothetical protein
MQRRSIRSRTKVNKITAPDLGQGPDGTDCSPERRVITPEFNVPARFGISVIQRPGRDRVLDSKRLVVIAALYLYWAHKDNVKEHVSQEIFCSYMSEQIITHYNLPQT